MDKNESRASGNPEEKKVSVGNPPVKEMDLVDQVWERFIQTSGGNQAWYEGFKAQDGGPGLKIQDLYCAFLVLYNDINKALRPGPHHDPPTRKEVEKCLKPYEKINDYTMLGRVEFNAFFELFTKNVIRRDELQSFFKAGVNQPFVRLGSHTKQESQSKSAANCSSGEPVPSLNLKTEDSEDLCMKKSKDKNTDCEDLKAPNGGWNVLRHGRTDSAVNLNSFSGGSHFQIFNFANADMDSLATFVKQIRK